MIKKSQMSVFDDCIKSQKEQTKVQNVVPTSAINSEYFSEPQKIENLKDSIDKSLHKTNRETGVLSIKKVIKDRESFIRLYQSEDTINAFATLSAISSFKVLAMLVESLAPSEDNTVYFDKTQWCKYKLTKKTFRTGIKDLILSGFLVKSCGKRTFKYQVNTNIFSCGELSLSSYESETKIRRKYVKVITDETQMKRYGIQKSSVEDVAYQMFLSDASESVVNGVYASKDSDGRRFFKVYRGKFAQALLSIRRKVSAKLIAYSIDSYIPQNKHLTNISRSEISKNPAFSMSKSSYYRAVNDCLNSGLFFCGKEDNKIYMHPDFWCYGSRNKIADFIKKKFDLKMKIYWTKKEKKRHYISQMLDAKICNSIL